MATQQYSLAKSQISEPEHEVSDMIHEVSSLDVLYADLVNDHLDT